MPYIAKKNAGKSLNRIELTLRKDIYDILADESGNGNLGESLDRICQSARHNGFREKFAATQTGRNPTAEQILMNIASVKKSFEVQYAKDPDALTAVYEVIDRLEAENQKYVEPKGQLVDTFVNDQTQGFLNDMKETYKQQGSRTRVVSAMILYARSAQPSH